MIKKMFSLRYKQFLILIVGTIISFGVFLLSQSFGDFLIHENYLNEANITKRLNNYQSSFQTYVSYRNLSIKNVKEISRWVKKQKFVYLVIYSNGEIVYESGFWNEKFPDHDFPESSIHSGLPSFGEVNLKNLKINLKLERLISPIKFSDRTYAVSFMDSSETRWYDLVITISYGMFFLSFFVILMLYNRKIIRRIVQLSKEVSLIENGNLEHVIHYTGNDEISLLGKNANNMRNSIIARHKSEKDAWDANSELITSMSHDIRTPLTSLIGYLEILDAKNYNSSEQLDKYIKNCKEKSIQLKDLSDKLFQYFLVFGKEHIAMEMSTFDVQILFEQLLGEHIFELTNLGFDVQSEFVEESCIITVDILYLKRLFDNLFSNIIKYAALNRPVSIIGMVNQNELIVSMSNEIKQDSELTDSTNIGLKTCQKIVEQMNGQFETIKKEDHFQVLILFPIERNEKEEMR
jgi:His Kinase A (phosphoacceptor) domain./HAMP domain.